MNGWTLETLKEHYDSRFDAQEKAVMAALAAAEKAVIKAETAAERRFESVNEFRGQLTDQAATFMPRLEAEQRIGQLAEKVEGLIKANAATFTSMGTRLDLAQGRSSGLAAGWGFLVAGIGALVGLALLALAIANGAHP